MRVNKGHVGTFFNKLFDFIAITVQKADFQKTEPVGRLRDWPSSRSYAPFSKVGGQAGYEQLDSFWMAIQDWISVPDGTKGL